MVSIKITVTGVTGTADNWWFWAKTDGTDGDKIAWKSGSDAEAIYEVTITDATKIAYLKENGLAITGAKGLTAKVTVDVTKKQTETKPDTTTPDKGDGEDSDSTPPGNDGSGDEEDDSDGEADDNGGEEEDKTEETKEFTFSYEASKISEKTASIKITVTNVTGTTTGDWWFWANTDGGDGDKISYKSGSGAETIYEVTIADATKIAYIKENGLKITGSAGLNAEVTVTTAESTGSETPPLDEGDDDGDENGNDGTKTVSFTGGEQVLLEASKISENASSIKITVTNVTGTTTDESWWFWAKTDGDKGDDITWESKTEDGKDVYKLTIDDATKIQFLKENGLVIKGASGLTGKVTVTYE